MQRECFLNKHIYQKLATLCEGDGVQDNNLYRHHQNHLMLPRELVAKLRSMTETIKMLSTENVALREENDGLVMMRATNSGWIFLSTD